MTAKCTGTEYMTHEVARALGHLPLECETYGRMCCTTCFGFVIPNSNGKLRKHVVGSNSFSDSDRKIIAERAAARRAAE